MVLEKQRYLFSPWVFRIKSRPESRTIGIPDPKSRPDPEASGIPTRNPVPSRNRDRDTALTVCNRPIVDMLSPRGTYSCQRITEGGPYHVNNAPPRS
uniref:Uncharacterized protein n=1 Tax=Steinernema glaseri TaxID=37863 RepID=A0A1I8AH41_9BILA